MDLNFLETSVMSHKCLRNHVLDSTLPDNGYFGDIQWGKYRHNKGFIFHIRFDLIENRGTQFNNMWHRETLTKYFDLKKFT